MVLSDSLAAKNILLGKSCDNCSYQRPDSEICLNPMNLSTDMREHHTCSHWILETKNEFEKLLMEGIMDTYGIRQKS